MTLLDNDDRVRTGDVRNCLVGGMALLDLLMSEVFTLRFGMLLRALIIPTYRTITEYIKQCYP